NVRTRSAFHQRTLLEALGREDVALLAIGVVQQGDTRGAVGVVLNVCDLRGHAVLVVATEVDHAVRALVAPTLVAGGDTAGVVPTARLVQGAQEGLLGRGAGDFNEVRHAGAAASR